MASPGDQSGDHNKIADADADSPSSSSQIKEKIDKEFELSAHQLVHDYDDEDTIAEEEADGDADEDELNDLAREGEMPIEELLARYGGYMADSGPTSAKRTEPSSSQADSTVACETVIEKKTNEVPPIVAPRLLEDEFSDDDEMYEDDDDDDDDDDEDENSVKDDDSQEGFNPLRLALFHDESNDPDYDPTREALAIGGSLPTWKKEPRVGAEHQAEVPLGLQPYDDAPAYENQDRLLWSPAAAAAAGALEDDSRDDLVGSSSGCTDVKSYCAKIQEMRCVGESGSREAAARAKHPIPDDEQALYVLQQCGHSFDEALRRHRLTQTSCPPLSSALTLWSEEECANFERGISLFGKDFHVIQRHGVRTRSVAELVHFYYLWKKTERHDEWMRKSGITKDRDRPSFHLHPGYTEYMQGLADEQDLIAENYLLNDRLSDRDSGKPSPTLTQSVTAAVPAAGATSITVTAVSTSSPEHGPVVCSKSTAPPPLESGYSDLSVTTSVS